jgi:CRP-like cAMP-binding protein
MLGQTTSSLAPMLRKLELWVTLSDSDREALLALPYVLKSIESHRYIARDGVKVDHSCLLLSGFAYRQKMVATGERQILSIHMQGDLVDLQNSLLKVADHNVQALTPCDLAFIPREAIRQIAFERPAVGEALWLDTLVDGSIFREWIANVGRRDARTRLAHLLCEFALRLEAAGLGEHTGYELPMTQEQLADCTGLTPVHVDRTLMALGRDGLITRTGRSVSIQNWKALALAGDFQSAYLHMRDDQVRMD